MRLTTRVSTLKCLVIAPLIALLLPGCRPEGSEILQAAVESYDYGAKRPPVDTLIASLRLPSIPDSLAPDTITIETMMPKPSARINPFYKLIARIHSSRDYPPMGIRRGDNYLWRDYLKKKWITNDSTALPHGLSEHEALNRSEMKPHEPRLLRIRTNSVAFVACLDDCPSGHCSFY